jgi:1-aminocyclopropane-1-carboxylate synthase
VKPVFVSFHGEDQFTKEAVGLYELAITEAQKDGIKVRALLICNPHNPLGRCYDPEALVEYMKLCKKYSIHLIVDEIYALSIYKTSEPNPIEFKSVLAIDYEKYIDPNYLHVLYGFSKDLASGGFRLGCVLSRNVDLITALSSSSLFSWPSNFVETVAIRMLENTTWMETFVKANQKQLGERAEFVRSALEEYDISYTKGASAGFFLWLDLRKYLGKGDPEKATLQSERSFKKGMLAKGVYLTSGEGLTSEYPGFFRLCFVKDENEVREGLKRLKEALEEFQTAEIVADGADPIW